MITSTSLDLPYGITFGPDGNSYIANLGTDTIHEFSPSGTDLGVFASTGMDETSRSGVHQFCSRAVVGDLVGDGGDDPSSA